MKTACAQMRVEPGKPDVNLRRMSEYIQQAEDAGCDIIAFPEMCVGGYLLGDKWLDESFCADLVSYNEDICAMSRNITVLYGNVYIDNRSKNKDGRIRKYNAAYAFQSQEPVKRAAASILPDGVYFKTLFPNYRIFDDERYFYSMMDFSLEKNISLEELLIPFEIEIGGTKHSFACEICEDLWFNDYSYRDKPLNVSRYFVENGAQMIFNLSSSPWTYGKDSARNRRIKEARDDSGRFVPFHYVNCVSVQNNGKNFVTFDGDSAVYNENADVIIEVESPYQESLLIYDTSVSYKIIPPVIRSKPGSHYLAAVQGIRAVDDIIGNSKFPYIIGLSGGIDSALVACLVEQAVGKDRVKLFNLPSRYNSEKTRSVARHIGNELGIPVTEISIESLVGESAKVLSAFSPSSFNMENVQAKIRGTSLLSNIAGITGGAMTCNGNKVEIALGYATLYGDVNGVIAPIGDLLKTEVFALAEYMNSSVYKKEVIPKILIPDDNFAFDLPPTAELKDAQIDPMKWGYHDALVRVFTEYRRKNPEDILRWYLEGVLAEKLEIPPRLLTLYGLTDPKVFVFDLEWVVSGIQRSVFKRVQSPPIIIMSRGAYGYDVRESQIPLSYTRGYHRLKKQLLEN
jgi:NAD+ synthase (glutamine-hydrolysing)